MYFRNKHHDNLVCRNLRKSTAKGTAAKWQAVDRYGCMRYGTMKADAHWEAISWQMWWKYVLRVLWYTLISKKTPHRGLRWYYQYVCLMSGFVPLYFKYPF